MTEICAKIPTWAHPLVWIAVFAWEWLMGVTKFGSTIGVIVHAFKRKEEK